MNQRCASRVICRSRCCRAGMSVAGGVGSVAVPRGVPKSGIICPSLHCSNLSNVSRDRFSGRAQIEPSTVATNATCPCSLAMPPPVLALMPASRPCRQDRGAPSTGSQNSSFRRTRSYCGCRPSRRRFGGISSRETRCRRRSPPRNSYSLISRNRRGSERHRASAPPTADCADYPTVPSADTCANKRCSPRKGKIKHPPTMKWAALLIREVRRGKAAIRVVIGVDRQDDLLEVLDAGRRLADIAADVSPNEETSDQQPGRDEWRESRSPIVWGNGQGEWKPPKVLPHHSSPFSQSNAVRSVQVIVRQCSTRLDTIAD